MEVFTLLWAPAKEASVPHLVPADHLTTANSLSLAAAYGTIPVAAGLFSLLAELSEAIGDFELLTVVRGTQEGMAFYFDAGTFLLSALMISSLPAAEPAQGGTCRRGRRRVEFGSAWRELREGWQFVFLNPVVRAVNLGLATGLIGGGMLVPLGPVFAEQVLGAGQSGFGVLIFALGPRRRRRGDRHLRVPEAGAEGVDLRRRRVRRRRLARHRGVDVGASSWPARSSSCSASAPAASTCSASRCCTSTSRTSCGAGSSPPSTPWSACACSSPSPSGPFLSELLGQLSSSVFDDGHVGMFGASIAVPGVRLTLWTASAIIVVAGFIAAHSMLDAARKDLVVGHARRAGRPQDRDHRRGDAERRVDG